MVVVFMEQVPVCHPARGQLGDGLCDTCNRDGLVRLMNGGDEKLRQSESERVKVRGKFKQWNIKICQSKTVSSIDTEWI